MLRPLWPERAPSAGPGWGRVVALLKYGAALSTACVVAGVVTIWVRFESLDGIGTYAVTAAEPTQWFAAGLAALLETLFLALVVAVFFLAFAAVWFWVARKIGERPLWISRLERMSRHLRVAKAQVEAHPWLAHVVLPAALLALLGSALPLALRIVAGLSALALILAGLVRLVMLLGKRLDARPRRWLKPAGLTAVTVEVIALALLSTTWRSLSTWGLWALLLVVLAHHFTKHPHYAEMRLRDVVVALRRPLFVVFVAYIVASAVASEADKPSGLTLVKVTPASGEPFNAITIGQKQGRAAFLRLTPTCARCRTASSSSRLARSERWT